MIYNRWGRKHHYCKICGAPLNNKRSDAIYCSVNCRKKASRWAAQLNQAASDIASRIRGVQEYLDDDEQQPRAAEVLKELRSQIDDMLNVSRSMGTDDRGAGAANRTSGEGHT
jgi:uncharacterized Zn finger protein (UPF0148 family)